MKGRVFFWFIALLLSAAVRGAVLHVGPGQTYATPAQAAAVAQAGDTVLIHPHVYTGGNFISNLHGAPGQYIYFIGVDPAAVIFQGGFQAMHFSQVSYIHLEGVSVTGQTANGINIDDGGTFDTPSHHVRVRGCYFYDMGASGNRDFLKMSGVDDFWVEDCHFENGADGGSGIDMVGCHYGVIRLCSFKSMGANAIQAKGGTQYISMHQNVFEDAGLRSLNLGGSTDLAFFRPQDAPFEAADLDVYANVFIGSWAPIAYVGCVRVHVWNNTIILPQNWIIRILQETVDPDRFAPCGDNSFVNNIIYYGASIATHVNIGPNTDPQSFVFANNLWYRWTQPTQSTPNLPVAETQGIYGEDPSFVNYSNGDYRLNAGSPAIDAGMTGAFPIDFDGQVVPQGAAPDIGAFEFPVALSMALERFEVRRDGACVPKLAFAFDLAGLGGVYTIQRSLDARVWLDVFSDVLDGVGVYEEVFTDWHAPISQLYYRLRYAASDGEASVGPVRLLDACISEVLLVYPNPCGGLLYVEGDVDGKIVVVRDLLGRVVFEQRVHAVGGDLFSVDLSHVQSGWYVVSVGGHSARFVVMK